MKKFLAIAAAVAICSTTSYALDLSEGSLSLYGEGQFAAGSVTKKDGNEGSSYALGTLGLRYGLSDTIIASLAVGYYNSWGGFTGDNLNTYLNTINVVEANVKFKNLFDVEGLSLKIGRQYYGDSDSTVMYFGNRGLTAEESIVPPITSIDAVVAYYKNDNIKANVIYGNVVSYVGRDVTLAGFDVKYLNLVDELLDAQVYFYDFTGGLPAASNKYGIFGLKPTVKVAGLKASLEFAKNYGGPNEFENKDFPDTNLIKLDASYSLEDLKLTPRLAWLLIGGDRPGQQFINFGNYTPGSIYGNEYYGSMIYNDEMIFNVGADYAFSEKFSFSADLYNFSSRFSEYNAPNGDKDKRIQFGSEIDLVARYQYSEKASFYIGVSHLFANGWKNVTPDSDIAKYEFGVSYKF